MPSNTDTAINLGKDESLGNTITAPIALVPNSSISHVFGGGTGVSNQWNEGVATGGGLDPVVQHIIDERGAPHGKAPEKWWDNNLMNQSISTYLDTLTPTARASYIQNFDPTKVSNDFKSVYGRDYNFSTSPIGREKTYQNTFNDTFTSQVGRAPTAEEQGKFYQDILIPEMQKGTPDTATIMNDVQGSMATIFTGAIQDEQQKKAQAAADAAVAPGSAFDQWQKSYMGSLDTVEKSLQDYQSRLFDKLRPNLITSLKAQGLMDTGALNTAFAGAGADLTAAGANYIAGARGAAATDVANKRLELQSFPTNTTFSNVASMTPNLTSTGQTALQNAWTSMTNTNMANQNAALQRDYYNYVQSQQPSLLSQYAGTMLGGMAGGFGQAAGKSLGTWGK